MVPRHSFHAFLFLAIFLSGCNPGQKGPPAIGEAYVGPVTLNIRQELAPKSPVVAAVKHGEKLDVLQTRRRFVRVRTASGAMGWTDSRQLLSTNQMQELRTLTEFAAKLPSQGAASVFEALNMHTEPSRSSPSFAQIPDNGTVQVVAHRLAPKASAAPPPSIVVAPKPASKKKDREKKLESTRTPPPPMPKAPQLPPNWLELSRTALPEPGAEEEFARESAAESTRQAAREKEDPAEKPVQLEDWSLVRMKDGRTGWVLSRLVSMSIPDEVAQYAEGHRITSYFPLADITDGEQKKHFWLWTTITHGGQPFEFDGFRVFIWNTRRHRYETAYIERNVKGFYPVEATRGTGERGEGATFAVILQKDEQFLKKKFAFNGYRISLVSQEPYQPTADQPGMRTASASDAVALSAPKPSQPQPGMLDKLKERAKSILKR